MQLATWDAGEALQEIVEFPPPLMQVGAAPMETVTETTVTVAIFEFTGPPPGPVQLI